MRRSVSTHRKRPALRIANSSRSWKGPALAITKTRSRVRDGRALMRCERTGVQPSVGAYWGRGLRDDFPAQVNNCPQGALAGTERRATDQRCAAGFHWTHRGSSQGVSGRCGCGAGLRSLPPTASVYEIRKRMTLSAPPPYAGLEQQPFWTARMSRAD